MSVDPVEVNTLMRAPEHQMTLEHAKGPSDAKRSLGNSDFESLPYSASPRVTRTNLIANVQGTPSKENMLDQLLRETHRHKDRYGLANTIARSHADSFSTQSDFQKMMESRSHLIS